MPRSHRRGARRGGAPRRRSPILDAVILSGHTQGFERVPGLDAALAKVRRMTRPPMPPLVTERRAVLGFDIGSTGSKALALDAASAETLWEGYLEHTRAIRWAPRSAWSSSSWAETHGDLHVVAGGASTGSGREIAGSLLASCFGGERVFVLNEIAAHAAGALHYDAEVDTIFEIGGQDAKYIRLDGGRICDAAMNEACSAGTGSFIEEQGK